MAGHRHSGAYVAPFLFPEAGAALLAAALVLAVPLSLGAQARVTSHQEGESPPQTSPTASESEDSVFRPDTVFRVPGGPRVLLLDEPGAAVVSLRLSVSLAEGPVEAGSAGVLQRIRMGALESLARQIGARVDGSRTPQGIAYSVSGTMPDFDYLAWLIREAVAEPRFDRGEVEEAVRAAKDDLDRSFETAEGRLREELRRSVWPSRTPPDGTAAALDRTNAASLHDFWARSHQADRMTLVVVGHVEPVLILAAFQGIGAPAKGVNGPLQAPPLPAQKPPQVQILRQWYGEAFALQSRSDPRAEVAAALMAQQLRGASTRLEGTVELWEAGDVSALVALGAAYREDANAMRRTIRGLPGAAAEALDASALERTVARVRADFLFGARTPWGLADAVGSFVDENGDPEGAGRYLDALDALDLPRMKAFLMDLQSGSPIRRELRP